MAILDKIQLQKATTFRLGVSKISEEQVQIAVWQPRVSRCQLCLYQHGQKQKITMTSMKELGVSDVFAVILSGKQIIRRLDGLEYDFISDGKHIIDPYAKAVSGREHFGKPKKLVRGKFDFSEFDWSGENRRNLPEHEMVLYQCHVRGFTRHASSGVDSPGTFAGLQEKIPYLKDLGVNTLLPLPIYDFEECMKNKEGTANGKINYWGYTGDAFYFAPKAGYSSGKNSPSTELKQLIKALHQNGMNLILDMYFADRTPEFILECLRYYVLEFHVDGFRINQDSMDTSWLRLDPVLSHTKIFGGSWGRQPENCEKPVCYEMNDKFMVDARRFLKSDEGQVAHMYKRFREQGDGVGLIHYITQNNGFTLRDLISYDVKHNEANGERGKDGTEYNYSWNCGQEGPSRRKQVLKTREQQERNAFIMLILGMAVPMLLAGDEFGNSQKGNNNAYCQDNVTSWLDWRLLDRNRKTYDYVKELLVFRKKHPLYHQDRKLTGLDARGKGAPDVSCHGREPWVVDFSYYSRKLGILFYGGYYDGKSLYFAFNFHWDEYDFYLPVVDNNKKWKILFDTAQGNSREIQNGICRMEPRSIMVFESVCSRPAAADRRKKRNSKKRS